MPVTSMYKKEGESSWSQLSELTIPPEVQTELDAIFSDLESDYSQANLTIKSQEIILQLYKIIDDDMSSAGVMEYQTRILKYTSDPMTDGTDEFIAAHKTRVHQWSTGLFQTSPLI